MEIKNALLKGLDPYRTRLDAKSEVNGVRARGTEEQAAAASGDRVSLSPGARLHTVARAEAFGAPEVRQGKVDVLKDRIAAGDYTIDAGNIAEKLLESEVLLAGTLSAK
jgi:negative regulator of flagellin synthesis FlgM